MKRASCLFTLLLTAAGAQAAWADVIQSAEKRFSDPKVEEVPSLQRHVLPLMGRLGCNGRACHGSFQGQGGFRLSLFGYDFKMDHEALTAGEHPRIDLKNVRDSLILQKPTAIDKDEHGGGHRLDIDSWQYRLIQRWIEGGAKAVNEETEPTFVRLEVSPLEVVFKKTGDKAKLRVISHWSDGTSEDVTSLCRFQTNDEAVAKVDLAGQISATGKGDTHIVAFYDNGVVPVSVLLPVTDQVGPKYPQVPTLTEVDKFVVTKLQKLGVVPSGLCTDAEFLRRVSLDMTGTLPTGDEVVAFMNDTSPDKRTKKIDELLERPAYAAWWATKLCDTLGNSENQQKARNRAGSPTEQWYYWIEKRLADNKPYDDIVAGIVLAKSRQGNEDFESFCKTMTSYAHNSQGYAERDSLLQYWGRNNMKKPNERALSFSYAFLGVRLQCAECHKHPFDQWSQRDFQQFTAFFDRIVYGPEDRKKADEMVAALGIKKDMPNNEKQKVLAKLNAEGKVVPYDDVYIRRTTTTGRFERNKDKEKNKVASAGRVLTPRVLGGDEVVETQYEDPREPLMDWLRDQDNPYFARSFVNRVWASYFNVGIVEPADDMNLANAPSNKELLDYLAADFIKHKFDIKWLHRTIAGSRTYQLSWQTNASNELDQKNFSHAIPRRLPAEVVYDAMINATAGEKELAKRAADPAVTRTIGLAKGYTNKGGAAGGGGGGANYALSVFGKPKRETPCDCERSNEPSLLQTVYMHNDREVFSTIERGDGWLTSGLKRLPVSVLGEEAAEKLKKRDKDQASPATVADLVKEAYLRTFNRYPSEAELANAEKYIAESSDVTSGLKDLVWALLNAKEFVVNH